jgi:FtsP/CotA-like multicopper oxidase with cupredoxin domain
VVPLIRRGGRIGTTAALAWTLLAASPPDLSWPISSFDFSDAVYLDQGIDPSRIENRLERRPGATATGRVPSADRRPVRALELRGGYDATGCPVYFMARGALPRQGFRTDAAREAADRRRVYLFPRRGSGTDLRQDALFDTTSGVHPLGLWRAAFVRYTQKPFGSPSGLALLDELRARNGTDLDGTPLLKHVSEIASLEKDGFVQLATLSDDGSSGAPWMVWPIWADPRRERLPADAYLDVPVRPDGSAVDQEIEQEFVCLLRTGDYIQCPIPRLPPFVQPLPVPAELAPAKIVDLRLEAFAHRFHPDLPPSTVWGYAGSIPGPTLRVRRGEPVVVRCANGLPGDGGSGFGHPWTSCRMDCGTLEGAGFPGDFCMPGQVRDHRLAFSEIGPSTGWYSDGRLGFAAQNVYKGLAGFVVATDPFDSGDENDPDPRAWRLPSGPCDLPLMFADKDFDASLSHALAWDPFERDGTLGSFDTVNGAVQPFLRISRRKYRFRLLDAGPSRPYDLRWSNGRPFILLGSDSGFLEAPREIGSVFLAVGQRRDVVVDFSAVSLGTVMYLESASRRILKVIVDRDAPDPSRVPSRLKPPAEPVPSGLTARTLVIENPRGAWTVNGLPFDLARPHALLKRGSSEIWVIKNQSQDRRHPIDLLPGPFRILSRNGLPVSPEAADRRLDLLPGDELRLFVRVGDAVGRYILPCANKVYEDTGLAIRWDIEP